MLDTVRKSKKASVLPHGLTPRQTPHCSGPAFDLHG